MLPKRPKVGRGTGKRGRPPSRVRLPARENDGKHYSINREHIKGLVKIAGNGGLWKEEALLFPMNMLIFVLPQVIVILFVVDPEDPDCVPLVQLIRGFVEDGQADLL